MGKAGRNVLVIETLIVLAILMSGCTAHKKPSEAETTLANFAKDVVIPIEAENLKNPLPATQGILRQGQQVYMQSCALCHGTDGRSKTNLGRSMYPPAMDLTSPHVQHWKDAELFWIIQNGVRLTGMPSWKDSISAEDTWKLVNLIHHLPDMESGQAASAKSATVVGETEDQLVTYGKTLYRQEGCFKCHQLDGEGGKVGPDLTLEGTRGRSAQWLVGHLKDPSAYVPGSIMPSFKNLTDDQLRALTVFLINQKGGRGQTHTRN